LIFPCCNLICASVMCNSRLCIFWFVRTSYSIFGGDSILCCNALPSLFMFRCAPFCFVVDSCSNSRRTQNGTVCVKVGNGWHICCLAQVVYCKPLL
jgi:hypothetical protein